MNRATFVNFPNEKYIWELGLEVCDELETIDYGVTFGIMTHMYNVDGHLTKAGNKMILCSERNNQ